MKNSTPELIQQASQGDQEALSAILERYLPDLRAFIRIRISAKVRAHESSSDLVQSVCADVLQGLDAFDYRSEGQFRKWLYLAALHKVLDKEKYYGRSKRDADLEVPLHDEEVDPRRVTASQVAMRGEDQERLEQACDQLPEDMRVVISLATYLDLSYPEIGEIMERSAEACRALHNRALARLGILMR